MYYQGNGVPQDYAEAVSWYRKAADQGDAWGQDELGFAYYQGKGVPQDYTEAVRWFRKAADQGDERAQYDLGCMYDLGKGVQQDRAEAARWYQKAADQGDERAQRALGLKTHPSTFTRIYLSVALLGSVLLWIDSSFPWRITRNRQPRATALTGVFGLSWVGMNLYGFSHFGILQFGLAVNAFYFAQGLLAGTFGTMAVFLVWRKPTNVALKTSAILFIGFNLYAIAHYNLRHLASAVNTFYWTNGSLVGMFIPSAIISWLAYKKTRDSRAWPRSK